MCKYQMINWDLIFDEVGEHLENIYNLILPVTVIVKPMPQTPKTQTQKPKTKGPWDDTKIL